MSRRAVLAALGTVLGLQTLRALFPLLVYGLRDRFGVPSAALGGIALLLFAAAFAMPPLVARLGPSALPRLALALAVSRAALQAWDADPSVSLALAGVGTVAFVGLLAAMTHGRERRAAASGFLFGALLDVAVHALYGTRDLHWGGPGANAAAGTLIALTFAMAWHGWRADAAEPDEPAWPAAGGLAAWGAFLYLHLELLGNVARLSARTARPTAEAGTLLTLGLAVAWILARHVPLRGPRGAAILFPAALALGVALWAASTPGAIAVPSLLLTQAAAAVLLARSLAAGPRKRRLAPSALSFGGGFVLLLAFVFGHYAGYDLPLPFSPRGLLLAAALVLAAAGVGHRPPPATIPYRTPRRLAALALLLSVVPLARPLLLPSLATPVEIDASRVRAVTFNLHAGFDGKGRWSFDRAMRHLRDARPDVVALQEVSRGWLMNGSADLFELARESLRLPGRAGPSVRTDWGNAVFARWGIAAFENVPLPSEGLRIPRAVSMADVTVPGAGNLRVLATHLHHRLPDDRARERQAAFLAPLADEPADLAAILLGDFNALPDSECLRILARAGWRDVGGGDTFPSAAPDRRIDTILLRGPWEAAGARVEPPWGSDHRAVVADVIPVQ